MNDNGIGVLQNRDDANALIVNIAIDKTAVQENLIFGEDVDHLVVLIALVPSQKSIYFVKPGKGKGNVYSSQ